MLTTRGDGSGLDGVGMTVTLTCQELDQIVLKLLEINRRSGLARTLEIGQLILQHFFDGDVAAWRDRRRTKAQSIRRLAHRPGCPLAKSALNDAVAVYAASVSMPYVHTFGHVGSSHVAAVLTQSDERREKLLRLAERDKWSVRRLRAEVACATSSGTRGALSPAAQRRPAAERSAAYEVASAVSSEGASTAAHGVPSALSRSDWSVASRSLDLRELAEELRGLCATVRRILRSPAEVSPQGAHGASLAADELRGLLEDLAMSCQRSRPGLSEGEPDGSRGGDGGNADRPAPRPEPCLEPTTSPARDGHGTRRIELPYANAGWSFAGADDRFEDREYRSAVNE